MGVWWMARTLPLPSSSPSLVRISAAVSASRKPKRSSSAAEVKPAVCVAVAAAAPPVAPPVRVVWPPGSSPVPSACPSLRYRFPFFVRFLHSCKLQTSKDKKHRRVAGHR